jgi:hypothetical protein
MKKFIALYLAPVSALELMGKSTPEQMKTGMEEWMKWGKEIGKSLVEMGAPLGKTKHVTVKGISDTKNEICGYSIVETESLDAAAKLFEGHPHFRMIEGASVDVLECMPMPK